MHSSVYHFVDEVNRLSVNKSLKKFNKLVYHDIKYLCQWMESNKQCVSPTMGKQTLCKRIGKHCADKKNNFRVSGQKIILKKQLQQGST